MTESLYSQNRPVLKFPNKRSDKPIRIRPAAREDLDALFALDQRCFRPGIAYSKTELRYFLFHLRSVSVVAEDAEAITGFAIVEFQFEQGRRIGHVVTIDVAPEHRRCGVGRLLMDALLDVCREAKAESIRLEVAVDNEPALTFYKSHGFSETGRIPGFYLGKLDALTMKLPFGSDQANEVPVDKM